MVGTVVNSGWNFGSQAGAVIQGGTFWNNSASGIVGTVYNYGINFPGAQQAGFVQTGGVFWNY